MFNYVSYSRMAGYACSGIVLLTFCYRGIQYKCLLKGLCYKFISNISFFSWHILRDTVSPIADIFVSSLTLTP